MTGYSRFSQAKFLLKRRLKPHKLLYSLFDGPDPYRRMTSHLRMIPDFLIIGAMRAGSTSLYQLLTHHPDVQPPLRKEIYYFDQKFTKGESWYRAHFPKKEPSHQSNVDGTSWQTCEASPYYLQDAYAPQRIFDTIPKVKLLAILRNPVERAYSNYWQQVRWGYEKRPIEAAFRKELETGPADREISNASVSMTRYDTLHFSYLSRGRYVYQLQRWLRFFHPEQLLVLISEEFFANLETNIQPVFEFLGVQSSGWSPPPVKQYNKAQYPPLEEGLRTALREYYRLDNERLSRMLNKNLNWD